MGGGGKPEGRRRLPWRPSFCDGYSRGPSFVWRWLAFIGPAVALEFVVWVTVLVPKMSPGGIEALINQLTWVSGPVIVGLFVALPGIVGLTIASGPPADKDSYCHMALFGLTLGSALCARLLGVEFEIFQR